MFAWRFNEHGDVVRATARLVATGCKQREGIDFFETFAPTPAASCFRLLGYFASELVLDSNRSLYGLKQASRSWHNHLVTHMKLSLIHI